MSADHKIPTTRRLIIHCGAQKTGSTSLHHIVGRNRRMLARHLTVLTPSKGTPTRELGRAATQFSLSPSDEARTRLINAVRTLHDGLMGGTDTVLISHENLCGAMIGNQGTTTLYPRIEEILTIVSENFAPLKPEFVFYTRPMNDWKQSVYGQAVRSDKYTGTRAEFLSETRESGTWDQLERRMTAAIGTDRLRMFGLENEPDDRRPAQQLFRHAGLTDADIATLSPIAGKRNQSLNSGALEFLRLINGMGLDRKAHRAITDLIKTQQQLFMSELV